MRPNTRFWFILSPKQRSFPAALSCSWEFPTLANKPLWRWTKAVVIFSLSFQVAKNSEKLPIFTYAIVDSIFYVRWRPFRELEKNLRSGIQKWHVYVFHSFLGTLLTPIKSALGLASTEDFLRFERIHWWLTCSLPAGCSKLNSQHLDLWKAFLNYYFLEDINRPPVQVSQQCLAHAGFT